MKTYLNGSEALITVLLLSDDGSPLSFAPLSVDYTVEDQNGNILVAKTPVLPYSGGNSVTIQISSLINTLSVGNTREIRAIKLTCSNGGQKAFVYASYIIEVSGGLEVGKNSYQTFQSAELLATEIPNLDAWVIATRAQKTAALIEARERIGRISLYPFKGTDYEDMNRVRIADEDSVFSDGAFGGTNSITKAQLAALPVRFVNALCKAQVAEANFILDDGSAEHKAEEGLLSEKIGESSLTFSSGVGKVRGSICRKARGYLSSYIVNSLRVGRG